jgi:hypothetical protein
MLHLLVEITLVINFNFMRFFKKKYYLCRHNLENHKKMDSIGDYIYIIILVVAVLSGLLKKRKKSAEINMPEPAQSEFEEFEQDFEFEKIEPKIEVKPEIAKWERSEPLEKATLSYENTVDFNLLRLKKDNKSEMKPKVFEKFRNFDFSKYEDENVENDFELALDNANDFKRAVIYSEVLNRKY